MREEHQHGRTGDPGISALFARKFARQVEDETNTARKKFARAMDTLDCDEHLRPRAVWIEVMVEELGKLARCGNKLSIAEEETIKAHWKAEGRGKLITLASLIRRMAEEWDRLSGPEGDTK